MAADSAIVSLGDPLTRAVILPLAASALGTGAIRLAFGEGRGAVLASLGLGIGTLAAWLVLFGMPAWPAYGMAEKGLLLIALGLLIGAAADRIPSLDPVIILLLTGWPLALLLWLFAPTLAGGIADGQLLRFGILLVSAATLFVRLREEQDNGQSAPVLLLWFGVALGLVAYVNGEQHLAEAGAALAAAIAGYLLWNIPVTRYPFGFAALLAGGAAVVTLAATLFAEDVLTPLWPLILMLFAGEIGCRLFRQGRGAASTALGGLIPAALAVALAYLSRS